MLKTLPILGFRHLQLSDGKCGQLLDVINIKYHDVFISSDAI